MAGWTIANMPDLTGHIAVVTGANSALGLETSRGRLIVRGGARQESSAVGCMRAGSERGGIRRPRLAHSQQPRSTVQ